MKATSRLTARLKIAKRYARALFGCALEEKKLDDVHKNFSAIAQWLEQSQEFSALFKNPKFPIKKLQVVLEALFQGELDPLSLHFVYLLARHDRLDILKEICLEFENLCFQHTEVLKVKITSASDLSATQLKGISSQLKARFKKDIKHSLEINPGLIGGFKIQIGDLIHDFSIQTQLENFKKQLLSN